MSPPPYTYSIHNKDLTYTIADLHTGDFSNIKSDLYTVMVCDNLGCKDSTVIPLSDQSLTTNLQTSANVSCFNLDNGTIDATTTGGFSPFSYNLYNETSFIQGPQLDGVFNALNGDLYFIETIDDNSCKHYLPVNIIEPDSLYIKDTVIINNNCFESCDGSLEIVVSGGTLPYQYSINNGATTQVSNEYTQLCEDNLDLLITDENNCTITLQNINITQPDLVELNNLIITDPTCIGCCDGSISIQSSGASQFSIDNGITFESTGQFTNLCDGTYYVTIQNDNECMKSEAIIVGESPIINMSTVSHLECNELSTGSITLETSGGIPPYTYEWNSGQTTMNLENLNSGTYVVDVTDSIGTIEVDTFQVNIISNIDITVSQINNTLTAEYLGAQYQWIDCDNTNLPIENETNQNFIAYSNGNYAVIITSGNCSDTSQCLTIENISVEENINTNFNIYPNPTKGKITIELNNSSSESQLSVYDLYGKVITKETSIHKTTELNLTHLESGIYYILLKSHNQIITTRISILK